MAKPIARISIMVFPGGAYFAATRGASMRPFFPEPTFTDYNSPDAPLEAYYRGKLGLISLATIASTSTQPTAISSTNHLAQRNRGDEDSWNQAAAESAPENIPSNSPGINWIDTWKAARNQALGEFLQIRIRLFLGPRSLPLDTEWRPILRILQLPAGRVSERGPGA